MDDVPGRETQEVIGAQAHLFSLMQRSDHAPGFPELHAELPIGFGLKAGIPVSVGAFRGFPGHINSLDTVLQNTLPDSKVAHRGEQKSHFAPDSD